MKIAEGVEEECMQSALFHIEYRQATGIILKWFQNDD